MRNRNFKNKISNMKGSKGITLVALIITIIILLILAVVAIGAVNNTGIIQYAQNSADEYTDGRDEENTTLQNYMDVLNHYNLNKEPSNPLKEIAGLYYGKETNLEFKENGICTASLVNDPSTTMDFSYTYNEDNNIVSIIDTNYTYVKNGESKILENFDIIYDSENNTEEGCELELMITSGIDSLAKPENATYINEYEKNGIEYIDKVVIENGKIYCYTNDEVIKMEENCIMYKGIIYRDSDDNWFESMFKISDDGITLTGYGQWNGEILTKE